MATKSDKKRTTFRLHAPEANTVMLAGSFNEWDATGRPTRQDKKGIWRTTVSLVPGVHAYRFVVDEHWRDDPACKEHCGNAFGTCNSVVRV